jgi:hydrogenase expression/formation protein HypC
MCLAIPGHIEEIYEDRGLRMARASFGGTVRKVCIEHVPDVGLGDYVLVHVGFAISTVDPEEARRTLELLEELGQLGELEAPEPEP